MNSHKKLGRVHVSGEINLSEEKKKKTNESLDKFMTHEYRISTSNGDERKDGKYGK